MLRPAFALAAVLPLLAACATYTPRGVGIAPPTTPARVADAERRQAELAKASFGTTADRGQGAPLPVPMTEPLATGGTTRLGTAALPPVRVSPAVPTNAATAAYNRETNAMMRADGAPLDAPGRAEPEPVAAMPLAPVSDTATIAAFALATDHAVGEPMFERRAGGLSGSDTSCARYASADEAQRAFLAVGGPDSDPLGLDPDGDGFACDWSPEPFRRMAGD